MSFLKKYTKSENNTYINSKKIGQAIYSIGFNDNKCGIITKTDLEGEIIWEKRYSNIKGCFQFINIIACSNSDFLVLAVDSLSTNSALIRINSNGDFIWEKRFQQGTLNEEWYQNQKLINVGNEIYFLMLNTIQDQTGVNETTIYKIGATGSIISQKNINSSEGEFYFGEITSYANKLSLYGGFKSNTTQLIDKGVLLELDFNLSPLNIYESDIILKNVKFINQEYIISGLLENQFPVFIKHSTLYPNNNLSKVILSSQNSPQFKSNRNFIYLESCSRTKSIITKIDNNFDVIWTKRFEYPLTQPAWGIIKQVTNDDTLLLNFGMDQNEINIVCIGKLDLDINSCKTFDETPLSIDPKGFFIKDSKINYSIINSNYSLSTSNLNVENLNSVIEDICSSFDPQCIKDEKICAEYNKLLEVFTNCIEAVKIKNPDFAKNLIVFKECFKKFSEFFNQININYPHFNLVKNLQFQINAIHDFIDYKDGKEIDKYYLEALSAVEFILEYLSQLGNCNCENVFDLTDYSSIQSGYLYLQSAGSLGDDSTKGIHLRWALRDVLSNHLPKANYATTTHNFNKSDDFVKIYRSKYVSYQTILDFNNIPLQVNEIGSQRNWIYEVNGKIFHVHFKDISKYNLVRATINPATEPLIFVKNYGDGIIEVETKTELSFKISPKFQILNSTNSVKTELLSVSENKITSPKSASLRKKYTADELNEKPLLSENIRSIRFSSTGSHIELLSFEFYSDIIINTKKQNKWNFLGKYALTKETNVAYQRLEPEANCLVNWLRYNDQAYVNVSNYHTRWNSNSIPELERIHTSVEKYIEFSDAFNNPTAVEIFPFENYADVEACSQTYPDSDEPEYDPYIPEQSKENSGIEIPFLEVLKLGSLDYHVARMLGLGTLDLNPLVFDGEYVYLSEYTTFGDLNDGLGARQVQHLYCSLPTSLNDQRLPVPIDLKEPIPGIFFNNGYDDSEVEEGEEEFTDSESINLVTQDGYSPDGKTKYYSLFPEYAIDELADAPFYYISNEFVACETTDPVFAGLEYRKAGEINWIKPELSYNPQYFNIDTSGIAIELTNETVELVIPEQGKPIFTHAVRESGFLDYSSYGINWFSRATPSNLVHTVETIISPKNELLPPTNVTATLIQKELPLLLSTSDEQFLFGENPNQDKSLVRLTFEYNHAQELIDYHQKINGETIPNYYETDNGKELFAEKIQIFFRNQVPNSVSGKVSFVGSNSNPLLIEVDTAPYPIYSSGIDDSIIPQTVPPTYNETLIPIIPNGTESNYIGSVMLVDNVEYVIHEVDNTETYPKFIVFKADASGAILNLSTVSNPETEILVPEIGSLFMIVENMQNPSIWGQPNNTGFSVNIDHTLVHREDELIIKNIDCTTETHVQKFRGIYQNATIEKVLEKVDEDGDGEYDTDANDDFILKHLGLYKITFPGFKLPQHSQYYLESNPGTNSVEWYNGVVRLHTLSDVNEPRKEFKVIRTENIGSTTNDLVLYIEDLTFPSDLNDLDAYKWKLMDDEVNSISQMTNYYPGYKVYLYKDDNLGLNEDNVLPQGEDEVRYTVFGLRSWDFPNEFQYDNTDNFFSKMSVPALMFANAVMEPIQPQKPTGGMYATRPDYFGKSSYTFNTKYGTPEQIHKPYSVQFNRASDIQFLSAIYDNVVYGYDENEEPILNTVQQVMRDVFLNGEEEFYVDRWNNLLNFDYDYTGVLPNDPLLLDENGFFRYFEGKRLPMPNNKKFVESINLFINSHNEFYNNSPTPIQNLNVVVENGIITLVTFGSSSNILTLETEIIPEVFNLDGTKRNGQLLYKDFLKDVLLNCFVPLTEIPVLYNFVKPIPYKPIPKKQVIRDRNGNLIKPTLDPESNFDMAPMMCRIDPVGQQFESQFTDYGLDGASNAKYFYAVREINNQMKTSDYSEILGPISLVNTAPPIAPEIIKVIPVLENRILGITPSVQLQINAYPKAQNIAKVSIYRADNPSDALSIRTMKLVRVLDLEVENLLDESKWIFEDDFSDLSEIPFGDPLFYRLTVSRRIRYNDKELVNVVDYAPSEASKLIITNVVENYSPISPVLDYYSEPLNSNNELSTIVLHWEKTCYKGKYHLYKMNSQGNWVKIHELQTNNQNNYLPLTHTNLQSGTLSIMNDENNSIYHHFKIITENTAGMMSNEERILTIHNEVNWQDIGGIGEMIVGGTFYIR